MSANHHLNGTDYLMLGFDHELRRRGFAGNSCQIVLELGTAISAPALQDRLDTLRKVYPILSARRGGVMRPRWKLPAGDSPTPRVRLHQDAPLLNQRLFNEPLATERGELMRFDLIERPDARMNLIFTWAHALMDAPAAEHFLAVVGRPDLPWPAPPEPPPRPTLRLGERCRVAWKNLHQIDRFSRVAPRSLESRLRHARTDAHYHVQKFSAAETDRVRANATRYGGALGAGQFHAAATLLELHRLHQRLGCPSPSYVLPVPIGLRPKGTLEPLFSNQLTMLMTQFLPEHLDSVASAIASLQAQTVDALRAGLIESSRLLTDLFRFLPLPIYMAILKHGLRGEICSLFFGDTAAVSPLLTDFMGASIDDFAHIATVTPSPGLGVIFYYFRGQLRVTVLYLATALTEAEAVDFAAGLRTRLLET